MVSMLAIPVPCWSVSNKVKEQLKAVIDNLYILIAQSHEYLGSQTTHAMTSEM
jgi:hypothetical protein